MCWFCFFKQKTAYEMRISDWSSDVCSSDLAQDQAASFLWGADIAHAVETGAGDRDRSFELGRAVARGELGHACGAFDGDIGGDLTQQPTRDQHTASPVALGERRRQAQPKLLSLIVVVIDGRKLIGEQARRLFKIGRA